MKEAIFSDQIGSLASWQYFGRRSVSSLCCFPNIGGKTQKTHWSQVFVSQILTQQQDARHHQKRKLYLKGDTNTNTNINKHKCKWWIDGYNSKYKTNTNTKVAAKWGIDRSHRQLWPSGRALRPFALEVLSNFDNKFLQLIRNTITITNTKASKNKTK